MDGVGEVKRGPQPYEGILSVVCETFGLGPEEAERQDWRLVKAILDYRTAERAVDAFNDMEHGQAIMQAQPHLMEMLKAIIAAQTGTDPSEVEVAQRQASPEETE